MSRKNFIILSHLKINAPKIKIQIQILKKKYCQHSQWKNCIELKHNIIMASSDEEETIGSLVKEQQEHQPSPRLQIKKKSIADMEETEEVTVTKTTVGRSRRSVAGSSSASETLTTVTVKKTSEKKKSPKKSDKDEEDEEEVEEDEEDDESEELELESEDDDDDYESEEEVKKKKKTSKPTKKKKETKKTKQAESNGKKKKTKQAELPSADVCPYPPDQTTKLSKKDMKTLFRAAGVQSNLDKVKQCVESFGLDNALGAKDLDGWSAMLQACRFGNQDIVEYLIEQGADVTTHASVCFFS